jgi:hypothetical protein
VLRKKRETGTMDAGKMGNRKEEERNALEVQNEVGE